MMTMPSSSSNLGIMMTMLAMMKKRTMASAFVGLSGFNLVGLRGINGLIRKIGLVDPVGISGLVGRTSLISLVGISGFGLFSIIGLGNLIIINIIGQTSSTCQLVSLIGFIGLVGLVSIGLGRHNGVISLVGHICISGLVGFIGFGLISLVSLISLSLISHYGLIGFIGLGISFMGLGISLIGLGRNNHNFDFIGLGIKGLISLVSLRGINGLIRRISLVNSLQFKIEMKPSPHDFFWRESGLWCEWRAFSSLAGLDSVFKNALQNAKQFFSTRITQMTKYCIMRECENILHGYLYGSYLVFVILKGIYGFEFPKRFLEISSKDLTSFLLQLI
jgi:hypothetical protein